MLGWLDQAATGGGDGAHDLMRQIAAQLSAEGVTVRGAIQTNTPLGEDCHCDMVLKVLGDDGPDVTISQDLGGESKGCRLDAGALEGAAVGEEARLVRAGVVAGPDGLAHAGLL